jgi:hypothetical protein
MPVNSASSCSNNCTECSTDHFSSCEGFERKEHPEAKECTEKSESGHPRDHKPPTWPGSRENRTESKASGTQTHHWKQDRFEIAKTRARPG